MKQRIFFILITCACIVSCGKMPQETVTPTGTPIESAVTPSSVTSPSYLPVPVQTPERKAAPEPEKQMLNDALIQDISDEFNRMVRDEFDKAKNNKFENYRKQKIYIHVLFFTDSGGYDIYWQLDDDLFETGFFTDRPNSLMYSYIYKYTNEMLERSRVGLYSANNAIYLGAFEYTFDPDCKDPYANKYFYLWEQAREEAIEKIIQWYSIAYSSEGTVLFCNYREVYARTPEAGGCVAIVMIEGVPYACSVDFNAEEVWIFAWASRPHDKLLNYYLEHEFDRAEVVFSGGV